MKNKTPLILGAVFVLLVIIFLLTSLNPREVGQGAEALFPDGAIPNIDRIELTSTTRGQIFLERQNGAWNITKPVQYSADENFIMSMLQELRTMQVDGIVTTDDNARSEFNASDEKGTSFKAYSNGELVIDVVVGRHSIDLAHTYIWSNEDKAIELWRGLFSEYSSTNIDGWRDKTIYSFNPGDIVKVVITDAGGNRELAQEDATWKYAENGGARPVNDTNVTQYLSLLAGLRADGFAEENDMSRVIGSSPDTHVAFTVRNGDIHEFDVWTPQGDGTRYLMRKKDGDIVFRFYQYRGSMLAMPYEMLGA